MSLKHRKTRKVHQPPILSLADQARKMDGRPVLTQAKKKGIWAGPTIL